MISYMIYICNDLWRIGVVKEIHKNRGNQIRGALVRSQSYDLKGPVNKLYPVEYIRGMDDCSLSKVKRPRGAATIVGELKRKFAN